MNRFGSLTDDGRPLIGHSAPLERSAKDLVWPELSTAIPKTPRRLGGAPAGLVQGRHSSRGKALFLTAGQVSDYTGAAALLASLAPTKALLADKGYDADWLRDALADRRIEACIPSKSNRKIQIPHDRTLYRKRHRIENIFGKLKDWRRIHTRYDRCAHTFMSAIAIAAIVIFWI